MLKVVGREGHMKEAELNAYPADVIEKARDAVEALVIDKMEHYLLSENRA